MSEDLGLFLDELLLSYIRVAGIFFVGGIALFNFTSLGKQFSIISLTIALVLLAAALIEYFYERNRISDLGFYPKKVSDVLAFIMIGIIIFIVWVIWEVWWSHQVSLSDIAKEIEHEVDVTNEQLIAAIKELDEKIIEGNQNLVDTLKGKGINITKPISKIYKSVKKYPIVLKSAGIQDGMTKIASLAAVS